MHRMIQKKKARDKKLGVWQENVLLPAPLLSFTIYNLYVYHKKLLYLSVVELKNLASDSFHPSYRQHNSPASFLLAGIWWKHIRFSNRERYLEVGVTH